MLTNRNIVKSYIREHTAQLAVFGIGMAIAFGIAILITGDFTQGVEAARHRNR
jgi:hypothetical protein